MARWAGWLVPIALAAAAFAAYAAIDGVRESADEAWLVLRSADHSRIRRWVEGFGAWGPIAVLFFLMLQTLVPVIPSWLMMIVGVLAYGGVFGGALVYGGLLLAATLAYGIGGLLGPPALERLLGKTARDTVRHYVCDYGFWAIVVARVSPAVSTDAVSIAAGALRMGIGRFLAATALGTLPLTVLIAWLGSDIDRLQTGLLVGSVLTIVGFVGYVVWDRRRR